MLFVGEDIFTLLYEILEEPHHQWIQCKYIIFIDDDF